MYEFVCGHQECGSQLASSDKEALMRQVADHLKKTHDVPNPTQTILSYLESACVTTTPGR